MLTTNVAITLFRAVAGAFDPSTVNGRNDEVADLLSKLSGLPMSEITEQLAATVAAVESGNDHPVDLVLGSTDSEPTVARGYCSACGLPFFEHAGSSTLTPLIQDLEAVSELSVHVTSLSPTPSTLIGPATLPKL